MVYQILKLPFTSYEVAPVIAGNVFWISPGGGKAVESHEKTVCVLRPSHLQMDCAGHAAYKDNKVSVLEGRGIVCLVSRGLTVDQGPAKSSPIFKKGSDVAVNFLRES